MKMMKIIFFSHEHGHGHVIVMLLLLVCMELGVVPPTTSTSQTTTLPHYEVQAIKEIAKELNKNDWNFSDPCSNETTIDRPRISDKYSNTIICNCSISANFCHIQSISFIGQYLDGVLPPSLAKLPYLKKVILEQNYLTGPIPHEWASTKFEHLVISANNLSGPIPGFLGNITTLYDLSLESNMFSGAVPREFGKLVNMEKLYLSSNSLNGALPWTLSNLTKLQILKISSNKFTGRIPDLVKSWRQLKVLEMQASGFEGPIPSNLFVLNNLTQLRISDLNGGVSEFPNLRNMKSMERLMLRSCNIRGRIPDYLSNLTELKTLDLSFNRLEGTIPNLEDLLHLAGIYLTSNQLIGPIPYWIEMRDNRYIIDLSYNNFSKTSIPPTCRETLNLFQSFSDKKNQLLSKCLSPCSKDQYSLHINCGGKQIAIGNIKYEQDEDPGGAAKFVHSASGDWGFSSTGDFWDVSSTTKDYIANNVSILRMNTSELYTTARLSPLSLTYYARCLANGNYTVKLHFAEIVFRDYKSYSSTGKRFFDVYIQGTRVLKDFNIEKEAKGVNKEVIKIFKALVVNKILEIRFQWGGKGTTNVPKRGIYGSLVSAISMKSDFKPPDESKTKKLIVVGIVSSFFLVLMMALGILWWKGYLRGKPSREQVLKGLDLKTGILTFDQIKAATNNFDAANKIGEGGFGSVYKGVLLDGTIIAVKQLSSKSKQGNQEFVNEIGMISALQHPNLVKLHGCCAEGKHLLLVYEYMENNSLAHSLFGESKLKLDWSTRHNICLGIARGLAFLQEESPLKIVHRDIKATNILLDKDLNPKISDFGLAKLNEEENTHISTRVAGTIGYMAPEYVLWGYLTPKADVYSFGIVALELVAGIMNTKFNSYEEYVCLLDWALVSQQKGNLIGLVDPKLGSEFNKKEAIRIIEVALLCTNPSPALRPTISSVVSMLEGRTLVRALSFHPSVHGDRSRFQALSEYMDHLREPISGEPRNCFYSSSTTEIGPSSTSELVAPNES
ncbi:hypothetical protein G4B88_029906 [Cannabis sativa]|uniref:non-specific serine/threonine protein kinase n=1 Tax=Cannabis sativa TaxID=3483 RepID=A0A7J6DMU0_CANSA|nr:hypothetical protein G4B88_029906 [Cannabis sativa]